MLHKHFHRLLTCVSLVAFVYALAKDACYRCHPHTPGPSAKQTDCADTGGVLAGLKEAQVEQLGVGRTSLIEKKFSPPRAEPPHHVVVRELPTRHLFRF